MRTMYDSVNPSRIPRDAQIVAGYVNGPYAWSDTDWALFPNAVHVGIAVRASYNGGQVLDVEAGDALPAQAPGWVEMRRVVGVDPSIYCSESLWPSVARAFNTAGVVAPHWWIAHYDGIGVLPTGAVAKQYRNTPDWDLSVVADFWPGVDTVRPMSPIKEGTEMQGYRGSGMIVVPCNGLRQFFCAVPGYNTGEHADGRLYFIGDTPVNTHDPKYLGDMTVHFDADRPGPVTLPAGVRAVSFLFTSTMDFTAWCA